MAKYMLIMRATDEVWKKFEDVDFTEMVDVMGKYNDELISAGVLVSAEGLDDAKNTVVVDFSGETPVVTEGAYGPTESLFNGYYILNVATVDEAVDWAKRMPMMDGAKAEIRRIPSIDEFPQDNEYVVRERSWREKTDQL